MFMKILRGDFGNLNPNIMKVPWDSMTLHLDRGMGSESLYINYNLKYKT